jgi:hypothetical protein
VKIKYKKPQLMKRTIRSEDGQISIFLGIILLVVVSFIAFVINVGLFVKAKINLQNAVDASAYAGAAVQARQLTNIGHLNWELRNTYKEWMFKYYILGQIGLDAIDTIDGNEPPPDTSIKLNNQGMNFRLRQFKGSSNQYYNPNIYDLYNVPSTCIHYGSNNNICEIVSIPGLPRFNTVGLPSISQHHEAFLNSIVATKAEDCSSRSNINQGAAMLWAYGTETANLFPGIPEIAANRPGAWIQALELSLRMRNLEHIVNTPPIDDYVCQFPGATGGACGVSIDSFASAGNTLPFNERFVKAFYSGYKNLSGGASKASGDTFDFGTSFRLRELPPTPFEVEANSLSGFLIPATGTALVKYYLDLQVFPLNLATFYTTFVSTSGSFKNSGTKSEADCGGTKTALPVPGYIMGFQKNPEVLTYYAVEGESDFVGLFYPFYEDQDGITLKTYSAAKPFGGRLGPALFKIQSDTTIIPREDTELKLTSNYVSALDVSSLPSTGIKAGYPIPTDQSFWSNGSANNVIGGNPTISGQVFFGIPNLIYDYDNYNDIKNLGISRDNIQILKKPTTDTLAYGIVNERHYGLYDIKQFRKFSANKTSTTGQVLNAQQIAQSIYNVRRPTRYEALNYLVPVMDYTGANALDVEQANAVHPLSDPATLATSPDTKLYRLFAPLTGPGSLYPNAASLTAIIGDYITTNQAAVDKYTLALKNVADQMKAEAATSTSGDAYLAAANSIHNLPINATGAVNSPTCLKLSMAQKFHMFFLGNGGCGIIPLRDHATKYFEDKESANAHGWQSYYVSTYTKPDFDMKLLLSGYKPGPRQGANSDDTIGSPFFPDSLLGKRNSYSTKFFALRTVTSDTTTYTGSGLPTFVEGTNSSTYSTSQLFNSIPMRNTIQQSEVADYGELWF